MTPALPAGAVVRVSHGDFAPGRLAEVTEMANATGTYLAPAIKALPGLISYYVGVSPSGSMVHVSIWASDEQASQMGALKEMIVDARAAAAAAGVTFLPIVNYPIGWSV